jgi:hypothetical protein
MFSLKAHQSENKIISVLKLSCKDDFNQAKFNKYNVQVQPIVIFKISYKKKVMGTAYHVGFNFC